MSEVVKLKEILADFERFVRHEAMRMNVRQDEVWCVILDKING